MGKERDSNHAETFNARQEEIHLLKGEIKRLTDLFNQGHIDEEEWQRELKPLQRRLRELKAQERAERNAAHREWFIERPKREKHSKHLTEAENKILSLPGEERKALRKSFKKEIENRTDKEKQAKRFKVYKELEGWAVDLHPEWIYWRIFSHLRDSPFIQEEIYEKNRSLLKEVSRFFRNWGKRLKRRKGKRKTKAEYSAEDFPRSTVEPIKPGLIDYKFMPKIEEEAEIKGAGGIITFDDEGRPIQKVPGYGPGVPPERDKLENALLSDLFHFLITREKNELIVYELLESISSAFLSKGLTTAAIQQRIRRHPN